MIATCSRCAEPIGAHRSLTPTKSTLAETLPSILSRLGNGNKFDLNTCSNPNNRTRAACRHGCVLAHPEPSPWHDLSSADVLGMPLLATQPVDQSAEECRHAGPPESSSDVLAPAARSEQCLERVRHVDESLPLPQR